ncbi:outer membrane beta-barrel protein [Enterovibrio sp. ZSDZ42]|uniref:Outer membrane beta-barrel protein n=1 Tax=Enterovibrio gelatinilyticus TaxID=2899819 RepID=A0ABT5QWG1_9GAMM|nr:outer membrane beta-barrel protein [Enterovibrio sp. ZSDZ42]MDD1792074.1 outer membrane beta-barrel protein [Enterovibrio sp. ZSDZ42]
MIRSHLWVGIYLFFPLSVAAVEPLAYQTENGIDIIPTLKVSAGSNDNVRRTTDNTVSSPESIVSPKVMALLKTNRSAYQFDYRFDAVNYSDSSDDNYIDHQAHGAGFFVFDVRNRLLVDYVYNITHEPRGTGLTEGFSLAVNEPIRFQRHNLKGRYTYGAAGTKGRLVGIAGYESKEYDDVTYIRNGRTQQTRYFNWKQPYLASEFYYAVSNYFYAVAVASVKDRNYEFIDPTPGISRDSLDSALYGGLEWDITGKTQGKLLAGIQNKDFSDSRRKDFQGLIWRANMSWAPTDYSTFKLEGRDYARDPNINADYVKDRSVQLDWEHNWTPRFMSIASARYGTNEYPLGVRKDDDTTYELTLVYSLKRWWDVSLGVSIFERDSSLVGYSYEQTRLFIGMEVSL